jgi:predicted transglutaminase-like cysteine proteinase
MLIWPAKQATLEETVRAVHSWVTDRFLYIPDEVRWKDAPTEHFSAQGDHWETDAEILDELDRKNWISGDCDAFAKLCWMALRKLEVPSRLVFCITENGVGHLVCEASGWILDNRQGAAVPRQDLSYRWIAKSDFLPGGQWTTA